MEEPPVYIVAIGWLYVVLMMSVTETSFIAGLMTFFWYGLFPCGLFLWLVGTPQRRRNRLRKAAQQELGEPDGADAKAD